MKQYLDIIRTVLDEGSFTPQRAKVDGKSVGQWVLPGMTFRHDLRKGFPLLTTKRVPFHLVAGELEFFIRGEHRKEDLHRRGGNTIWDEWKQPGQEDPNELGRIYGMQWRRWRSYVREEPDRDSTGGYRVEEIDQLKNLITTLQTNPWDRRTLVTAWNPAELDQMALPACHVMFQTIVTLDRDGRKVLNLCMTMRSADLMLGVPFNIASYAMLTLLLAKHVGMVPGVLQVTMNNAHIYENHVDGATEQMARQPRLLPEVVIPDRVDGQSFDLFQWTYDQVEVRDYEPEKSIRMRVAV